MLTDSITLSQAWLGRNRSQAPFAPSVDSAQAKKAFCVVKPIDLQAIMERVMPSSLFPTNHLSWRASGNSGVIVQPGYWNAKACRGITAGKSNQFSAGCKQSISAIPAKCWPRRLLPQVGCLALPAATQAAEGAVLLPPDQDEQSDGGFSRRQFRTITRPLLEKNEDLLEKYIDSEEGARENAVQVLQLLLELWVSRRTVSKLLRNNPEIFRIKASEVAKRVAWFVTRGCTPGKVGSAIGRRPALMTVPTEKISALEAYFESMGIAHNNVGTVILKAPEVLDLDPNNPVEPLIGSLADLLPKKGRGIIDMIERQPMLLSLTDVDLAERTAVMAQFGMSQVAISNLCYLKPMILLYPPRVLAERFQNLLGIFSPRRLPNIFKVAPTLVSYSPERINEHYANIVEYLGEEVAFRTVNSFPQALSLSWEKVLLPKLEYLLELGLVPTEVVNFPAYLGYSLEDRIRPRCELLLEEGFTIGPHDQVIFTDSEKRGRKIGKSHRELLASDGSHSVCIQHIVGLRDDEFESQFGVGLEKMFTSDRLSSESLENSDLEESEDLVEDLVE